MDSTSDCPERGRRVTTNGVLKHILTKETMLEKTLALIKPDAVEKKYAGKIIDKIEQEGFTILDFKKIHLTKEAAGKFYNVHKGRPFYDELVNYMSSGPIIAIAMERENAVIEWRNLMGATDPAEAKPNTLRKLYGTSKGTNSLHGSDSAENGKLEINFFFPNLK